MYQAYVTYGNGVQRAFYSPKTQTKQYINKREIRDGMECIVNDMAVLRDMRHKVLVTESEDAPTRKIETMMVSSELMKSIPQSKTLTLNMLASKIVRSADVYSDEDKAKLEMYEELEMRAAEMALRANIA